MQGTSAPNRPWKPTGSPFASKSVETLSACHIRSASMRARALGVADGAHRVAAKQ